jgi:flagellar protein FliO/FliZ
MIAGSTPPVAVSGGSVAQLTLSLLAVVGLILAITWVCKRFKLAAPKRSQTMGVLDAVAIGPRERVVLVRVGESQVLLGVSAAGIVGLSPLLNPIVLPAAPADAGFAHKLREFMQRPAERE